MDAGPAIADLDPDAGILPKGADRDVLPGRAIPALGTGKTDYLALAALLESASSVAVPKCLLGLPSDGGSGRQGQI